MTRMLWFFACWLSACGADLGALGGVETHTGHFVGGGRLAVSSKLGSPLNERGLLVGAALEARGEQDLGSRWNSGLMLGWGDGPAAIDGRLGWELFGEIGTPLHGTLFRRGDLYTGLSFALPIHFGPARQVVDLNESTWILTRRLELVPLLRTRLHRDHREGKDAFWRTEISFGVSLRMRAFTDLL